MTQLKMMNNCAKMMMAIIVTNDYTMRTMITMTNELCYLYYDDNNKERPCYGDNDNDDCTTMAMTMTRRNHTTMRNKFDPSQAAVVYYFDKINHIQKIINNNVLT